MYSILCADLFIHILEYKGEVVKFWQAMKELEEGKKVRCKDWASDTWIDRKGDDSREEKPSLYWTQCVNKEWELYEEPKEESNSLMPDGRCFSLISDQGNVRIEQILEEEGRPCFKISIEPFPPEHTLTFDEVVKGLKEWKRFRRKSWPNIDYCIHVTAIGICESYTSKAWFAYPEDFEATDWVEVR